MALILTILQGLIFSLVAMAVYLTSRVLKRDDLSVEGTFGIGGAITATLLMLNVNPFFAILGSFFGGSLMGAITGTLFALGLNHLMAGLVTTTACFSISLGIAGANKMIFGETIFTMLPMVNDLAWLLLIAGLVLGALIILLRSEVGLLLKTSGENPDLLTQYAKSSKIYQTFGFSLANGLTAIAGSLFVQWSGFFSITGNVGVLVAGLSSLMIAELIHKNLSWMIILASIFYQGIFSLTLSLGVAPMWNNLVKAILIILLMILPKWRSVWRKYA